MTGEKDCDGNRELSTLKLFLSASGDVAYPTSKPFLCFGPGKLPASGSKLEKSCDDTNSLVCAWHSDSDRVVLEMDGADSAPASLFDTLLEMEKAGIVGVSVVGHTCQRSPDALATGNDRFAVAHVGQLAIRFKWAKPGAALRFTNCASAFAASAISAPSSLVEVVWRVSFDSVTNTLSPKKPLLFPKAEIKLEKHMVVRVL